MRIEVFRERCCGSGYCTAAAPELFDQDPAEGRVLLLAQRPTPDQEAAARSAADECPTMAIEIS
ncbi:ferredoxin [Streptomyces sp. NPDC087270]|uniref:ferredoxin n=1 Tax=Streptomyces sp. NPDC087270 TaxID=3365774 RepID=UPI0037FDDB18